AAVLGAAQSVFGAPSDRVRIATAGIGGRGPSHLGAWNKLENVELVAVCDVDDKNSAKGVALTGQAGRPKPQGYRDFRKMLEDKSIDAVSMATPNHWHTLQTIWAVQAGKDVYVEKPCSHNMFEAKQIVAATRKYNKMVQMGSQIRSALAPQEAVK